MCSGDKPSEVRDAWGLIHTLLLICAESAYVGYRAPKPARPLDKESVRCLNKHLIMRAYHVSHKPGPI